MEDVINKVCGQLITNPHIIGIIQNCNCIEPINNMVDDQSRVDLCIISREAGNQKLLYTEDGFTVCLRWRTVNEFMELVSKKPIASDSKKILYDKTGLINEQMNKALMK